MAKRKTTTLKVDPDFFDKVFERERKKLEIKTGVRVTQPDFTKYLYKRNVKFVFPEFKSKMDKKYFPKKFKRCKRI